MIIHDMRSPIMAMIGITEQIMETHKKNNLSYYRINEILNG